MKTLLLCILLTTISTVAQQPAITWQKSLGGTQYDGLNDINPTPDGGYIICGYTTGVDGQTVETFGGNDGWLTKLDANKNVVWQKAYGGNKNDQSSKVLPTPDGGYVFTGFSYSDQGTFAAAHGNADMWVVKTDASGNVLWQRLLGGNEQDIAMGIALAPDGGYVLTGQTYSNNGDVAQNLGASDCIVLKLDEQGNTIWTKLFGGNNLDYPNSVSNTADGGYIIGGHLGSADSNAQGLHYDPDYGMAEAWAIKIDGSGNLQWERAYGSIKGEQAYTIKQTSDGGYIMGAITDLEPDTQNGDIASAYGNSDFWIVKLNATGNIVWEKTLGGTMGDHYADIVATTDGFIAVGSSTSEDTNVSANYGETDIWMVKVSSNGQLVWEKNFGGILSDRAERIFIDNQGTIIVGANTESRNFDVAQNFGRSDIWLFSVNDPTLISGTYGFSQPTLYPNPASEYIYLNNISQPLSNYSITDNSGRIVLKGNSVNKIDVSSLASGIYQIQTGNTTGLKFIKN
ncbi:T9SS type A sorting domain-containing protein [Flavobacterium psychrotrophum]|uniref:T9SS type A sorting domain-containing protein n=1 Tax=Flavobacterium psychrotrophum TaxID=2294119 RepID=UPI000E31498D|nr:T9SS type A sorting domain-containing protein [Flavobacterium psychrotrophum]